MSALKLARWQGLDMWVRDQHGTDYQIISPVIIGVDAIQFASGRSFQPVSVAFSDIAEIDLH